MFQKQNKADFESMKKYFDLAAMGTVADLVPLLHENRTIAKLGLEQLNGRSRPGIDALLKIAKHKRKVTSSTIGFTLGPRINAAGRLEHANLGVELLLSESLEIALEQAKNLNSVNTRRQQANETILKMAEEQIAQRYEFPRDQVIVIDHLDWHAGMIGITASHLLRKYHRPTVVIGAINESCRGSIRGLPGFDVTAALQDCSEYLIEFGGHKEAAGFSIEASKIEAFRTAYIKALSKQMESQPIEKKLEIDAEILPSQITLELTEKLQTFQPFGKDNPVPVFVCKGMTAQEFQAVGDGTHLKAIFNPGINSIGFGLADKMDLLRNQNPVDVVFSLDINEWNGKRDVQMHLVDIKNASH